MRSRCGIHGAPACGERVGIVLEVRGTALAERVHVGDPAQRIQRVEAGDVAGEQALVDRDHDLPRNLRARGVWRAGRR
mgnify:CR=1 FL=1